MQITYTEGSLLDLVRVLVQVHVATGHDLSMFSPPEEAQIDLPLHHEGRKKKSGRVSQALTYMTSVHHAPIG